jgi:hypothetical protein
MNDDLKSLMVWIPAPLHNAFKQKVAGQGKTVKHVIISFLEAYVGTDRNSKNSGTDTEQK